MAMASGVVRRAENENGDEHRLCGNAHMLVRSTPESRTARALRLLHLVKKVGFRLRLPPLLKLSGHFIDDGFSAKNLLHEGVLAWLVSVVLRHLSDDAARTAILAGVGYELVFAFPMS